jgi:hypothetical protein
MLTPKEIQVLNAHRASWEVNPTAQTRRALAKILFQLPNAGSARELLDNPFNGPAELAEALDAVVAQIST